MATRALDTDATASPRPRGLWARLFAYAPVAIVFFVSAIELALADRKYGLFTGGFGMSRAIESFGQRAEFLLAYGLAQAVVGLAGWLLALRLTRKRPAWAPTLLFAMINGLGFCMVLAAQYQLHSYFSDAISFALIRQLGGGSLYDAFLFGLSEIALAAACLLGVIVACWIAWRIALRVLPPGMERPSPPRTAVLVAVGVAFVTVAWFVGRSGDNAAYGLERTIAWSALDGALDYATDFDRDGYGMFGIQHDAAPFDPARHPLALDIPGNGIDEDGYGGDLHLVPVGMPLGPQVFTRKRPNVVVVVFESTRGDVIGKRVNGKLVAPNLDALARNGSMVYPSYSHVAFTTESLKSIFSGALVPHVGDPSMFRDFKASGYRIGVFSGQAEDFGDISKTVGMKANADVFFDAEKLKNQRAFDFAAKGSLLVDESHLLKAFDDTFGKEDWKKTPHFAYFNFQSAHFPYDHPGVARRIDPHPLPRDEIDEANAKQVRETYWNAVANSDYWLGQLIARLKAKGVWDNTILVVSGDHGEDLFEDGFLGHGHVLNTHQFATVFVGNRPGMMPKGPIALDDYRGIITAAIRGETPPVEKVAPFMHIGPIDTPTTIGLAGKGMELTTLRLDTGEACLVEQHHCGPIGTFSGKNKQRIDAVIARWGSERWRERQRLGTAPKLSS
ncbi:LTA synthase family protein [Tsuneonella mangrovi]|uniref:LTA synthase family protein n=1 Tax=Tsuneonella mangrovi TaxID=1982042 RepID=UPI000BA2AB78|nr:sulfatase-like hydrolase/transferase [Tsuneonella mangrovi]